MNEKKNEYVNKSTAMRNEIGTEMNTTPEKRERG